jgi:hypothetical protein
MLVVMARIRAYSNSGSAKHDQAITQSVVELLLKAPEKEVEEFRRLLAMNVVQAETRRFRRQHNAETILKRFDYLVGWGEAFNPLLPFVYVYFSFTGVVAIFTDADSNGTATDYQATIAWGDGTTSSGTIQADPNGGPQCSRVQGKNQKDDPVEVPTHHCPDEETRSAMSASVDDYRAGGPGHQFLLRRAIGRLGDELRRQSRDG